MIKRFAAAGWLVRIAYWPARSLDEVISFIFIFHGATRTQLLRAWKLTAPTAR